MCLSFIKFYHNIPFLVRGLLWMCTVKNSCSVNYIADGSKNIDKAGINWKRSLFEMKAITDKIGVL